jgi:hypothetical protein
MELMEAAEKFLLKKGYGIVSRASDKDIVALDGDGLIFFHVRGVGKMTEPIPKPEYFDQMVDDYMKQSDCNGVPFLGIPYRFEALQIIFADSDKAIVRHVKDLGDKNETSRV